MDDRRIDRAQGEEHGQGGKDGLSPRQEQAVRELVRWRGRWGVNRSTLFRWMQEPGFVAAMNRWRSSVTEIARGQLFAMLGDAVETVGKAVKEGDGRLALAVLEKMGAMLPAPGRDEAGMDAGTVSRRQELERRAERIALDRTETQLTEAERLDTMIRQLHKPPVVGAGEGRPAPATAADAPTGDIAEAVAAEKARRQKEREEMAAREARSSNPPKEEDGSRKSGKISPEEIAESCGQPLDYTPPPSPPEPATAPTPPAPTAPQATEASKKHWSKPYGGLNPWASGPVEPTDPLDELFTDVARLDE